ncbi:MAG: SDR family NAD(P)-dependent oxidoreductase [Polyangiales bacterium]
MDCLSEVRSLGEIQLSRADWDAVLAVNLTGATMMVQEVVAKMIESGSQGVVVNISSIARHGNRGQSNYVAAKAALAANTRTWMREFARLGFASAMPGVIQTP